MKKVLLALVIIAAVLLGIFLGPYLNLWSPNAPTQVATKKPLYWIDPMEPQIHYPGPGKSRMNMDLVPVFSEPETKAEANTIKISPTLIQNLGVRTAKVEKGPLTRQIETIGSVEPNENKIHHVHTYAEGWIRNLTVKANGEKVTKGQLLVQLYSPILISAQREFLLALEGGNKELIEGARHKLQSFKITDEQIDRVQKTKKADQLIDILSPQDGFIEKLNVREGMRVTPDTELMSLVDLSSIWIIAQIYEQQAGWVSQGQEANAKLPAFPEKTWKGKVEYIYPELDPNTRTLKIRFLFDNPKNELKPNMYANITLFIDPKTDTLNIPIEALIRSSQGNHVIVALGEGRFQVRKVNTGIETNERVEILSGLGKDEQVVTSGQFLIDSEANLRTSIQRIEGEAVQIKGIGIIEKIDDEKHLITLKHEAIAEINMPAMSMDFEVSDKINLKDFKSGEHVNFVLEKKSEQEFAIIQLEQTHHGKSQ
ncbi:efflux RND transporter periplasmic adaptor subunit [Candidatus Berkiella aquae]|uniref:Cation efflux system protein CusB n=1 Tax=Candidatus Berkiella aquae TaxID=295108 RepID=A0A0Q9YNN5_9GAMM|nr:efflux RND transporter periplasmic adaptor subunit [Candidatus Berkiella aquae]MCS5712884.1 efflux RND transporter periplasmic adaptor subunit [Candidatus Berkiella aquae]